MFGLTKGEIRNASIFMALLAGLVWYFSPDSPQPSTETTVRLQGPNARTAGPLQTAGRAQGPASAQLAEQGPNPFAALDCSLKGGFVQNSTACSHGNDEPEEEARPAIGVIRGGIETLSQQNVAAIYEINGSYMACVEASIGSPGNAAESNDSFMNGCRPEELNQAVNEIEARLAAMPASPEKDEAMVSWLYNRQNLLARLGGVSLELAPGEPEPEYVNPKPNLRAVAEHYAVRKRLIEYLESMPVRDEYNQSVLETLTFVPEDGGSEEAAESVGS